MAAASKPQGAVTCQACNGRGERNTVDHDTVSCGVCGGRGWSPYVDHNVKAAPLAVGVMVDALMQHASLAFVLGQDAKAKRLREIALELRNIDLEGQR